MQSEYKTQMKFYSQADPSPTYVPARTYLQFFAGYSIHSLTNGTKKKLASPVLLPWHIFVFSTSILQNVKHNLS